MGKSPSWFVFGALVFASAVLPPPLHADPLSRSEALAQCRSTVKRAQHGEVDLTVQVANDLTNYELLVEKSLTYRAETIRVFNELNSKLEQGEPLAGKDLQTLTEGMLAHLDLRDDLFATVNRYRCWPEYSNKVLDKELQLRGVMLSLSATLVLYDNYLLGISLFEDDNKLRRYLNESHQGYDIARAKLRETTLEYNKVSNRNEVRRGIKFFSKAWDKASPDFQQDDDNQYLYLLIMQSPSYNSTFEFSPLYVLNQKSKMYKGVTADTLAGLSRDGSNLFSKVFGNTVGLVQTRTGLLYDNRKVEQYVGQQLKAGDVLLEKTPFRLTDKFIPGYWGHVAVWIGNEQELKALGIWDDPIVKPFRADIRAGNRIVEALREGVMINPLHHFLNIDDLAVLRRTELADSEKREVILRALRQVGKPYDFNFNVETNDKIVCSELIYVTYTDIDWPTEKTLGRYTISPTNVAEKSGDGDQPFALVALFLEGEQVTDHLYQRFSSLH